MASKPPQPLTASSAGLSGTIERNIQALVAKRHQEERRKPWQDRLADAITAFTGSMLFVYIHLVVFGLWIVVNLGWIPGLPLFDPTFVILAMAASVEAIFLSTFVLISQNRMTAMANRRADLDLHISLLAEHEVTRLITLVTAIAQRMGIEEARNPELNELKRDIAPEAVLDELDQADNSSSPSRSGPPRESGFKAAQRVRAARRAIAGAPDSDAGSG